MEKPTAALVKSLEPGTKLRVQDEDGDFDGIVVKKSRVSERGDFVIYLESCHKKGSAKVIPGVQEFESDTIHQVEVIERAVGTSQRLPDKSLNPALDPRQLPPGGGGNIARRSHRMDNPHLSRLHPVQMNELLGQMQIAPPPPLHALDQQELMPRILPYPQQELAHMTGERFKDKSVLQYRIVREFTWPDMNTPPALRLCPKKLYVVDSESAKEGAFEFAIADLNKQSLVGLSVQGKRVGRHGELSLVLLSTRENVYVFDVVTLGGDTCFGTSSQLRDILEDGGVMKVIHDCRHASDMFNHKYQILLTNVYDTLAAHSVFCTWAIYNGFLPRYASPLSDLVRAYLAVKSQFIHFPHYRVNAIERDTAIWMQRPLPSHLEMNAVYDVMYLLDLQKATREAMTRPFVQMTNIMLADVRDANDLDCSIKLSNSHQLPIACARVLPNWKPEEGLACRKGILEPPFVHQSTCQIDPMLNFSRDVIHQKKAPGPHTRAPVDY
jgi:hypothetical protein